MRQKTQSTRNLLKIFLSFVIKVLRYVDKNSQRALLLKATNMATNKIILLIYLSSKFKTD